MRNTVRAALIAAIIGGTAVGLSGAATAAPLNDPRGLCASHDDAGNCVFGWAGPSHSVDGVFPSNYPQEQAVVDYLTKAVDEFEADSGPLGTLDEPLPPEDFSATGTRYTSGDAATGTQSVVVEVDQMVRGAAHPAAWYKSFTYDMATKAPVTFDTLFRPGTKPLEVIMPIAQQQLSAGAGQPVTIDPALGLDPANYQSFALTDDAVVFFIDRNGLVPAYGTTAKVSVPRSAVADLLTPGL
ncbi:esterase [Mycobacterium sp. WMMD1722]|uniref:esterase n=1 Tax=Mycobacterium sp. WMMD1722 TaxID=3404117 RepID=UPI003BF46219